MARRDEPTEDEATAARDFTMARITAARAWLTAADHQLELVAEAFVAPAVDATGRKRKVALEEADKNLGQAAAAVQLAMEGLVDVNPEEGEPEDDEEEDDDDAEEDEPEDEPAAAPRRRRR